MTHQLQHSPLNIIKGTDSHRTSGTQDPTSDTEMPIPPLFTGTIANKARRTDKNIRHPDQQSPPSLTAERVRKNLPPDEDPLGPKCVAVRERSKIDISSDSNNDNSHLNNDAPQSATDTEAKQHATVAQTLSNPQGTERSQKEILHPRF